MEVKKIMECRKKLSQYNLSLQQCIHAYVRTRIAFYNSMPSCFKLATLVRVNDKPIVEKIYLIFHIPVCIYETRKYFLKCINTF